MALEESLLSYSDIVSELIKRKITTLRDLYEASSKNINYKSFTKRISRLEKRGVLKSYRSSISREKFLYLHPDACSVIGISQSVDRDKIYHDALASKISRHFESQDFVNSVELEHEYIDSMNWDYPDVLDPDVILHCEHKNQKFIMGCELELHQKSRKRLYEKFEHYSKSKYFNYSLYIFNRSSVLNSYIKRIEELCEKMDERSSKLIKSKIILCLCEDIESNNLNVMNSSVFINDKKRRLCDLFQ